MLSDRGSHLCEITLRGSIGGRLDLERVGTIGLLFEIELRSHILHTIDWVVDL